MNSMTLPGLPGSTCTIWNGSGGDPAACHKYQAPDVMRDVPPDVFFGAGAPSCARCNKGAGEHAQWVECPAIIVGWGAQHTTYLPGTHSGDAPPFVPCTHPTHVEALFVVVADGPDRGRIYPVDIGHVRMSVASAGTAGLVIPQ